MPGMCGSPICKSRYLHPSVLVSKPRSIALGTDQRFAPVAIGSERSPQEGLNPFNQGAIVGMPSLVVIGDVAKWIYPVVVASVASWSAR